MERRSTAICPLRCGGVDAGFLARRTGVASYSKERAMPELQIISPVSVIASILLATGLVGSAEAEVKSVAPNGFEVVETVTIQAPPEQVYSALGKISQWWSSSHTFSHDAANLSL